MTGSASYKATEPISLTRVIKQTLGSLKYPHVFLLFFVPILISGFLVLITLWMTWGFWSDLFHSGLSTINPWWQQLLTYLPEIVVKFLNAVAPITVIILFLLVFAIGIPLMLVLNLAITAILASTYLVNFIQKNEFPSLEKKGASAFLRGLGNTIGAASLFLIAWVVTLPLWFIPGAQILVPTALTAWLNRKVCLFDALAEFASPEELARIQSNYYGQSYLLGIMTTMLNFIPFAILISPVLTMVAFTYYGLTALNLIRGNATVTVTVQNTDRGNF